jgi:hypothetical protein
MNPLENANKWEKARFESAHALMALGKLNSRPDIAHAQADAIMAGLIRKIGFPKVATKFENLRDEMGWSYSQEGEQ